jgi:uncharacterized membrane protein
MNLWELLSILVVASLVGMFSGPWSAITGKMNHCSFEVFVETVDRTTQSLTPAVTVLLPAAFLSMAMALLTSYRESLKIFYLNVTALVLLSLALIITIVFELPLVEEVVAWAALKYPGDWLRTRSQWLRVHFFRISLPIASLVCLLAAESIRLSSGAPY